MKAEGGAVKTDGGAVVAYGGGAAPDGCGFAAMVQPGGPVRVRLRRCCVAALITTEQVRCTSPDRAPSEGPAPSVRERQSAVVGVPS